MKLELTELQATFLLSLIHESIDKHVPTEADGTILVPTWIVDLITNMSQLFNHQTMFEDAAEAPRIILPH